MIEGKTITKFRKDDYSNQHFWEYQEYQLQDGAMTIMKRIKCCTNRDGKGIFRTDSDDVILSPDAFDLMRYKAKRDAVVKRMITGIKPKKGAVS